MENANAKTKKTTTGKMYDLVCRMGELECVNTTIHEMANILKRNYFEIIPIEPEDKANFVNNFYSMNELINVIWDYSYKTKKELDSISNELMEISKSMSEVEK